MSHTHNHKILLFYKQWISYSGFVEEGRVRKANWFAGQWKDEINMGILVEDWTEMRKAAEILISY